VKVSDKAQITLDAVSLVGLRFVRLRAPSETDSVPLDFRARIEIDYPEKNTLVMTVGLAVFETSTGAPMALQAELELRAHIEGPDGAAVLAQFADTHGVGVLVPYFRELFASVTTRAGYAPFLIPPMSAVILREIAKDHPLASQVEPG
jgi:preprotein translocase subunit SecB